MKTWKRLVSGLLSLTLLVSLTCTAFAAEGTAKAPADTKTGGQFTQWFPRMGTDPESPETSEAILARMGTVIKQTKKAGGATATLNGAVWDGDRVWMSLVVRGTNIPEEFTKESWLYSEECSVKLPDAQWKEYVKKDQEAYLEMIGKPKGDLEKRVQAKLDMGQADYWRNALSLSLVSREDNTLAFELSMSLKAYLEQPKLTLHIANLAIYEEGKGESVSWHDGKREGPGPGVSILKGPFDFTFTLGEPLLPVSYTGDVKVTYEKVPLRFTKIDISVFSVDVDYEVLAPVNQVRLTGSDAEMEAPDPNKLDNMKTRQTIQKVVRGVWTKDGKYVDCSEGAGSLHMSTSPDEEGASGSTGRNCPYVVDPALVTAVDLGGTRVELSGLKLLEE